MMNGLFEEGEIEVLLVDDTGDVPKMLVLSALAEEIEFVEDHIFRRCERDLTGGRDDSLEMVQRPLQVGMVF